MSRLIRAVDGDLSGMLFFERRGFRPGHRITAEMFLMEILSGDERYEASVNLALAIAPHLDRAAIRENTSDYRLAGRLLEWREVRRRVGRSRVRDWYDEILSAYKWNARYWDQRALFESDSGNHPIARSYAERSLREHPHPFGFNTLGTVLMRLAVGSASADDLVAATTALASARDWREAGLGRLRPDEYPYVTFFSNVLGFAEEWGLAAVPQLVRSAWPQWHRRAESLGVFFTDSDLDELNEWQRRWLSLVVDRP